MNNTTFLHSSFKKIHYLSIFYLRINFNIFINRLIITLRAWQHTSASYLYNTDGVIKRLSHSSMLMFQHLMQCKFNGTQSTRWTNMIAFSKSTWSTWWGYKPSHSVLILARIMHLTLRKMLMWQLIKKVKDD